jgi:hypothetical protein
MDDSPTLYSFFETVAKMTLSQGLEATARRLPAQADGTQWHNTEAWLGSLAHTTDLLGYPL